MIASLENIRFSFDDKTFILDGVTARVHGSSRIGLVGANGAGKTTLLNIICGDLEHDDGVLAIAKSKSIGVLRQDSGLSGQGSIISEMRGVFEHLHEMEREMRRLETEIAGTPPDDPHYDETQQRYAELQVDFETREGYHTEVKIATVLTGMGFGGVAGDTSVEVLSGGERTRLALCKLLLQTPDLLILDEPTNHLDFKTLLWLEDYLAGYKGALLIVSHDRYFLDRLCTTIWELHQGELLAYSGNYSAYLLQKDERETFLRQQYEAGQREIAEMKDFVARNIVRASTTNRAKSRQKALERLEENLEKPKKPPKPPVIRFQKSRDPVNDVLTIENLSLSVGEGDGEKQLISGLNLEVKRGEKLALIGANGVGKTSFFRALMGELPHGGEIKWGRGCDLCYFHQGEDGFEEHKTALDELWDAYPREYEHTVRTALGRVGLSGESAFGLVCTLSGGERARLKFAKLMLSHGNVLLLDEPTNHLDLGSKESVDKALTEYDGTLLVVSHDRYLLDKFPDKILEMHPDGVKVYPGRYEQYIARKRAEAQDAPPPDKRPDKKTEPGGNYRSKKQRSEQATHRRILTELEGKIGALETEIAQLEQEIASPELASDYQLLQEKCELLEVRRTELDDCLEQWSELDA
ncbi:MAG: ABC-F family ATP-binding cassette domain-containing protein [Oscillospiraceae bacterium]|nr:ABC-F family ATP-binding cassette domain-containing protein [Oscillospiraceae bacterium]